MLFSSLNTSNIEDNKGTLENITYDLGKIDASVPASSALSATAKSTINVNNNDYYDVIIEYTIHHKSLEKLLLVYKIGDLDEVKVYLNSSMTSSYELPEQISPGETV